MKQNSTTLLAITLLWLFSASASLWAQDGSALPTEKEKPAKSGVQFNGLGRTLLQNTDIDGNILEADTGTIRRFTDGEFLLDMQMNATPNDKTEVQTILRLRNEFGGFFGAGMTVEVRELWARGIIADAIEYHIGDMDMVMTPYTFYNFDEEGQINEAAAFMPLREVIHYEQFYHAGNTRRVQGAKLNFGLNFANVLRDAEFMAFIARVRGTDFFTAPSRYTSGGSAIFKTRNLNGDPKGMNATVGLNYVYTFDDRQVTGLNTGMANQVITGNWKAQLLANDDYTVQFVGESGASSIVNRNDSVTLFSAEDGFADLGLKLTLPKHKLTFTGAFIDVGPDFFSIAAQSRRIDLSAEKTYYDRLGTEQSVRQMSFFDMTRDRALYTFELSDRLMPYDPRFSNVLPYGTATPNRRGLRLGAERGSSEEVIEARFDALIASEIRGQGTNELKAFTLLRAATNLNLHQYFDFSRKLRFTLGYQFEDTERGGEPVEQINLTSNLFDLGVEVELFSGFELIAGSKTLVSKGNEYVPRIDEFNVVRDFPRVFTADDREQLFATGIKYTFKEGVYLTIQYHRLASQKGENNPNDFNLNQVFVLYTMSF
jgi:hypothetical protein